MNTLLGVTGAGVLAAAPASASTPVHNAGSYQDFFTGTTLPHYLGVPNKIYAGQAALLKPAGQQDDHVRSHEREQRRAPD